MTEARVRRRGQRGTGRGLRYGTSRDEASKRGVVAAFNLFASLANVYDLRREQFCYLVFDPGAPLYPKAAERVRASIISLVLRGRNAWDRAAGREPGNDGREAAQMLDSIQRALRTAGVVPLGTAHTDETFSRLLRRLQAEGFLQHNPTRGKRPRGPWRLNPLGPLRRILENPGNRVIPVGPFVPSLTPPSTVTHPSDAWGFHPVLVVGLETGQPAIERRRRQSEIFDAVGEIMWAATRPLRLIGEFNGGKPFAVAMVMGGSPYTRTAYGEVLARAPRARLGWKPMTDSEFDQRLDAYTSVLRRALATLGPASTPEDT